MYLILLKKDVIDGFFTDYRLLSKAILRQKMVYKSCPASEYAIWACFQTALPFPEENNGKKYDFSSICTIFRVIAIFRI